MDISCSVEVFTSTINNGRVTFAQTNVFLLFRSQHISAQICHHQVVREKQIMSEYSKTNMII